MVPFRTFKPILFTVLASTPWGAQAEANSPPGQAPTWDSNGYPQFIGPDRIEEWRPESFFRLFYKGELGSSFGVTGVEDFEHYEREKTNSGAISDEERSPNQIPSTPHHQKRSSPPSPKQALEIAKPPRFATYFTNEGVLLETHDSGITLRELGAPDRYQTINTVATKSVDSWRGHLAKTDQGILAVASSPFQLTMTDLESPAKLLTIPHTFNDPDAVEKFGVISLGEERLFVWATRNKPFPFSQGRMLNLSDGQLGAPVEMQIDGSLWARLESVVSHPTKPGELVLEFRGIDLFGHGDGASLVRLNPFTSAQSTIRAISKRDGSRTLEQLIPLDDASALAVYRAGNNMTRLSFLSGRGGRREQSNLDLATGEDFDLRLAPNRRSAIGWQSGGKIYWINLDRALIVIAETSAVKAHSPNVWDLAAHSDGTFEVIGASGRHHFSPFPRNGIARLQPFIDIKERTEADLDEEAIEMLAKVILADPEMAAQGFQEPHSGRLGLVDLFTAADWQGYYTKTGEQLVAIIEGSHPQTHPRLRDGALTLYAIVAKTGGHAVLAQRAVAMIQDSRWRSALKWALIAQVADPKPDTIDEPTVEKLIRWMSHFPDAFRAALGINRNRMKLVTRHPLPEPGTPVVLSDKGRFPDFDGRLIRGPEQGAYGQTGPVRLLN